MGTWNLGSVADAVYEIVLDIPATMSGAPMERMANMQRFFMERYTGASIGSTAISERYQQPLLHLTASMILNSMELEGVDVSSVKLGDLTIKKGQGSSTGQAKTYFYKMGMDGLRLLGKSITFDKSNG